MTAYDYDVITIGGGLGGAALAKTLAERGHRVLVLERTTKFSDRVRGEVLVPWGCAEAAKLGLYDLLHDSCAHELRYWDAEIDGVPFMHRDLVATLPTGHPVLTFLHPQMQTSVIKAAIDAGADIRRGAVVKRAEPGDPVHVTYELAGKTLTATARLAVGADGRSSAVRKWGGFEVRTAKQRRFFAGVLMEGIVAPEDTMCSRFNPTAGLMSWIFPQGSGRSRNYIGFAADSDFQRLTGAKDVPRFIETSISLGVPAEAFANATAAGPLATFDATDNWVPIPYRNGLALIGDAATTGDPTWGQGMSQTLFSVRVLAEALEADENWNTAGSAYAEQCNQGTQVIRSADTWYTDILLETGSEADARRARVLPLLAQDPTRIPEAPLAGPAAGADETVRQRFFGEI